MTIQELLELVPCENCASDQSKVLFTQRDLLFDRADTFQVVECAVCGLRYTNPRPKPENIGKFYENNYYFLNSAGNNSVTSHQPNEQPYEKNNNLSLKLKFRRRLMEEFYGYPQKAKAEGPIFKFVLKILLFLEVIRLKLSGREKGIIPFQGEGKILDIGCGTGAILNALKAEGWRPFGVEINPVGAKIALEKYHLDVVCGTIFDAKYPDNFFDVILFNHSLEHMYSPRNILKESFRVLKPGGYLMINLPNSISLEAWLFKLYWFQWDLPRHLYHFSIKTLSKFFLATGFKVSKVFPDLGSDSALNSLGYVFREKYGKPFRFRKIAKILWRPIAFVAGHLGFGSSFTVIAIKNTRFRHD